MKPDVVLDNEKDCEMGNVTHVSACNEVRDALMMLHSRADRPLIPLIVLVYLVSSGHLSPDCAGLPCFLRPLIP
eukprot:1153905-Pelagomonas_calceolata.AAC.2